MDVFLLYLAVFIGAATPMLEVWVAVPLGILAGLPWFPVALIGFIGNFITLLPVIYAGDRLKSCLTRWRKSTTTDSNTGVPVAPSRKSRIFNRYGLPGLAVLGPFVIGVHIAAGFAIASGSSKRAVLIWFAASILFCALFFALLTEMGMAHFLGAS